MRRKQLLMLGVLFGCSSQLQDEAGEDVGTTALALTSEQTRVLGFETPLQDWSSVQGTLSASSITTQGSASIGVTSVGWTEVASRTLSSLGDVGTTLSYDIRLPQTPSWGEARAIVQIPSLGISFQDLGGVSLAGRQANVFHQLTFNLPPALVQSLESTYSDLVIRVVLNKPALSGPVIIDNLSLGSPPSGTGGTGGSSGTGGSAGKGGSAGAAGSGGSSGAPTGSLQFSVEVPNPHTPEEMTIVGADFVRLNDRVTVGPSNGSALLASFGGGHLAASARLNGNAWNDGNLFLGSSAYITQTLTITGNVTRQPGALIGTETLVSSIPSSVVTFTVPTGASSGDVFVGNNQSRTLTPGSYGSLDVQANADLLLSSGTYTFSSFNVEPTGDVFLSKNAGPIQVYVSGSPFQFKGSFISSVGPVGDFLVGYLGTQDAFVQGPFLGTLLAPNAKIALHRPSNNAAHQGAFFGKSVEVMSDSTVLHVPFPWEVLEDPAGPDGTLRGDPDFPPVGPSDVPPITPTPVAVETECQADFDAVINPNVDANGDGFPDIVQLTPRATQPSCPAPTYCQRTVLPDGSEQFTPVPSTPLFNPALPVPAGAVTNGCSAEPAAPVCPVLASTGLPAEGCSAEPADPNCVTVTLCPDPGSFDDPNNPDVRHIFDGISRDSLPDAVPDGFVDAVTGEVRQILEQLGPLYINPCEWEPVLDQFTFPVDIKGIGKAGGEDCNAGSECQSEVCEAVSGGECEGSGASCSRDSECGPDGNCEFYGFCLGTGSPCLDASDCGGSACDPSLILNYECMAPKSPLVLNLDEGSSNWNVKFNGGVHEGRAIAKRAVFFPSAEFDVTVDTQAHLSATAFGRRFDLFDLEILSEISECGFNFDWTSRTGDDDFQVIDGLIRENLGVGVDVPGNVAAIQRASDPTASANCEARLTELHQAEKSVNEALHDALVASTFYNLAGTNGTVIDSQATAQGFIDSYVAAADQYETALGLYNPAQQAALDHLVSGKILDFEFNVEFSFVHAFGIGPFNPGIDIGLYGRAGLSNVTMENRANTHFTNTAETPCGGIECFELGVKGSAAPKAAVGLFAFLGGGINLGVAGGRIGIRGELDLANFQLPLAADFAIQRTTLPASALVSAIPNVPPELVPFLPGVASFVETNLFEVPPVVAQFNAPFAIGSNLESLEGPTVEGQFLSGRIKLWAKAWFLFVTKKWEKTIVSWDGIERSWHVAEPLEGDAFAPIVRDIGFPAVPNMVLLPKLELVATPGNADPLTTSNAINDAFDTQTIPMPIPYDAHHESDLGTAWLPSNEVPAGRCRIFTPQPPG